MAIDLSYLLNKCNHRIYDLVVWEGQTYEQRLFEGAAIFNDCTFGDAYMGPDWLLLDFQGADASFVPGPNNTTIATFNLPLVPASDPALFIKLPNTYGRQKIPATTFQTVVDQIVCGLTDIFYGQDSVLYNGAATTFDNSQLVKLWEIDYTNQQLIIYRYQPDYTWLLDFTTIKDDCPLCHGTDVKNDFVWDQIGHIRLVANTEKLSQQVLKAILTPKGKNEHFPWYGTVIQQLLGSKNNFLGFTIRGEIRDQLSRIKQMQTSVLMSDTTFYTPYEALHDILNVSLTPDPSDPRSINIKVLLMCLALEKVETKTVKI